MQRAKDRQALETSLQHQRQRPKQTHKQEKKLRGLRNNAERRGGREREAVRRKKEIIYILGEMRRHCIDETRTGRL